MEDLIKCLTRRPTLCWYLRRRAFVPISSFLSLMFIALLTPLALSPLYFQLSVISFIFFIILSD